MKTLLVLFVFVVINATVVMPATAAEYFWITQENFQITVDAIPHWLVGPVWVYFDYNGANYTAVHVLTTDTRNPYILLSQKKKAELKFKNTMDILSGIWGRNDSGAEVEPIIDRGNDICQILQLGVPWTNFDHRAQVIFLTSKIDRHYSTFGNVRIKVYLADDLPKWVKENLPSKVKIEHD